jgi:APA family basic amino acid/polyamine antiporter
VGGAAIHGQNGRVRTRELKRALGCWDVSVAGIGVILGAGVYALVAPAAALAGEALWLAFVVAGCAAALTAYAYARLGARRPRASPEFQYTALAFGPRVGFVAGWLMLAADVLAAAAVALGFGGYLRHLTGLPVALGAIALLVIVAALLHAGVAESVRIALVLTFVEAGGLVFVLVAGVPSWGRLDPLAMPAGLGGVSSAAALIFFAYLGFDELGNFAEEMRRPERDLPRALFVAMAASTLIYVGVALSATAVVGAHALGASQAPLALVARLRLGPHADAAMSVIALAATANTVLLLLASAARSVYGMAAAGVLSVRLARVSGTGIPGTATWVVLGVATVLVGFGGLTEVAAMTDAAVLVSFIAVNASLGWLGTRGRLDGGRLRRAVDIGVPALAVLMCGWLLAHIDAWAWLAAAALGATGLAVSRRR